MARKPIPGSDDGTWGDILNNFLDVAHTATGELRDSIVTEQKLASTVRSKLNATGGTIPDGSVTATKLANDAVTNDKIATGIAQSKITNLGVDLAAKADISALEGKANTTHTHAIVDVTNLQTSLDSKASVADLANKADVLALAGKASTNHTHAIVDVTSLQIALDSKANADATVNLTGVQTIAGVKTFSTLPVLPAGNPTSGNQAASKAYVDSVAGGGNTRYYTGGAWQARGASPFPVIYDAGQIDPVPQPTDWLPGDHIISLNPPIAP